MARTGIVLAARTGAALAKGGPASGTSCSAELRSQIRNLFAAAREEVFHDGMESQFSRAICALIRDHGNAALEAIRQAVEEPSRSYEAASEALRWLSENDDPVTRGARLCLLERALQHPSASVRDAAGIGLSALGDAHAIPFLEAAVQREPVRELREDLQQVLDELRESNPCHS